MKEQPQSDWFADINHTDQPITGVTFENGTHIVSTDSDFARELAEKLDPSHATVSDVQPAHDVIPD